MPVEYRNGDLFTTEAQALAHGCNCQGVMGAGIAVAFRKKYPEMYQEYQRMCGLKTFNLGSIYEYKAPDGKVVFNLGTQQYPGACAELRFIEGTLWSLTKFHVPQLGISSVAIPRIGCGLGGLNWNDVKGVIEDIGKETPITILVYSL
jgi:O-acetyl-ADP-ribose deacetylase (regulator of RNase III)